MGKKWSNAKKSPSVPGFIWEACEAQLTLSARRIMGGTIDWPHHLHSRMVEETVCQPEIIDLLQRAKALRERTLQPVSLLALDPGDGDMTLLLSCSGQGWMLPEANPALRPFQEGAREDTMRDIRLMAEVMRDRQREFAACRYFLHKFVSRATTGNQLLRWLPGVMAHVRLARHDVNIYLNNYAGKSARGLPGWNAACTAFEPFVTTYISKGLMLPPEAGQKYTDRPFKATLHRRVLDRAVFDGQQIPWVGVE